MGDLGLLHPTFRKKVEAVIRDARKQGQEFAVLETYRSRERQARLFAEGRSQLKLVGVHHFGLAADLVRKIDGAITWNLADYRLLGELADKHGLVWGGRWKFRDAVHLQAIAVKDQGKLFRGEWFPS